MAHAKSHYAQRTSAKLSQPKRRMCLATGVPDHYFQSAHVGERFCKACRERMHANPSGEHTWEWPFGRGMV
jgi:hypothetical protein